MANKRSSRKSPDFSEWPARLQGNRAGKFAAHGKESSAGHTGNAEDVERSASFLTIMRTARRTPLHSDHQIVNFHFFNEKVDIAAARR